MWPVKLTASHMDAIFHSRRERICDFGRGPLTRGGSGLAQTRKLVKYRTARPKPQYECWALQKVPTALTPLDRVQIFSGSAWKILGSI